MAFETRRLLIAGGRPPTCAWAAGLAAVLPLGDIQYNSASLARINEVYDPTWGRVKSISRPLLGNHESSGMGYFDYFNGPGAPNGPRGSGYYSFDIGSWHLIALNSNCARVSCSAGSEQERWLRADLAAHPAGCTLAYWHNPRYSSGHDGSDASTQPLWEALHGGSAEVLLSGHSHDYERLAPLERNGGVNAVEGIRQFVVGTGGAFFTGMGSRIAASEAAQNNSFGVLKLTLRPLSYDWEFVPEAGRTNADRGTGICHGPVAPHQSDASDPPPVISRLSLSRKRFRVGGPARRKGAKRGSLPLRALRGRHRHVHDPAQAQGSRWHSLPVGWPLQAARCARHRRLFAGRIGGRRLRRASYLASVVAFDAAGNRSRPRRVSFMVVRR